MHAEYGIFVYTIWPLSGAAPPTRYCRVATRGYAGLRTGLRTGEIKGSGRQGDGELAAEQGGSAAAAAAAGAM